MGVLDHDDGGIHHGADGDGDAAEAHDVGAQAQQPHADIGDQHAERQRDDGDERAARVQQENDADERHDGALLQKRPLERIDSTIDQVGAVVDGLDAHAFGKARRHLREPVLHVLNDRQGVLAVALERDARDDLSFAVHLGDAAALIGRQLDAGDVLQQNRHAAVALDHDLLEVGDGLDVAAAAHGKFGLRDFNRPAADIHIAVTDDIANFRERNAESLKPARIDDDAVLLDEAACARDFGDASGLGQAEANEPVLNGAKLGKALLASAHHVLIDPADARRVWAEAWGHARRKTPRGGAQIFEHARPRPIEVGAVLENDVNEGDAEEGEAAHHPRFRHGQHCRGQRISDLVLDHLRRLAGIFGVDDDLHVGEVGDGVERHPRDSVDAGERYEDRGQSDQKHVPRRPADDGGDHGFAPWPKLCSAALRLLSASMRKVAEVTTSSPTFSPSTIST